MTDSAPLSAALSQRILCHFELPADPPPTLSTLRHLVERYTRTVPWESASRIVRRSRQVESTDCILLGEAFWNSQFADGAGGTCYESNYAFFGLLRQLGYTGYLTINDIGGAIGCHSAIVILLDGCKYLVDVGYPIYAVLPFCASRETSANSPILNYRVVPKGGNRYRIRREPHPRGDGFLLHDKAVGDDEYRAIGIHDYRHDGGQFLNEIVIHKVVDGQLWRFNSDERPFRIQQFVAGQRQDHSLGDDPAGEVAERFGMSRDIVAEAMAILGLNGI